MTSMIAISEQQTESRRIATEEAALAKSGRLNGFHWLVVALSVLLTLIVWQYSKAQIDEKVHARFDRESDQILGMLQERLQKYEDALWAGVATLHAYGDNMNFADWRVFANALNIEDKYKGINGIGVIHYVPRSQQDAFTRWQREQRPDFAIHPQHDREALLPISYIVPVKGNEAAVGLDVAHETNRYFAAIKARDSGAAQITGPIVLVQDAEHTAGFLFYAPFYRDKRSTTLEERRDNFAGMVYAPFVVNKLMQGTLEKARRQVGIRISDESNPIYDEGPLTPEKKSTLRVSHALPVYGRNWTVDIWSTPDFHSESSNSQPQFILAGGIAIDLMLLALFSTLSRANRRSLDFAHRMSHSYQQRSSDLQKTVQRLESSNQELEQFAYVASHDLQEPLRTLRNYSALLQDKLAGSDDEQSRAAALFIERAATRMSKLVHALMNYNRIGKTRELENADCAVLLDDVLADLNGLIHDANADIKVTTALPVVQCHPAELRLLFQNLISNAVKFRRPAVDCHIEISCQDESSRWHFCVQDNGIGIAPENHQKIFEIFRRLHREEDISGSGIGLASCKKITQMHGGRIWLNSTPGAGSRFHFTLAKEPSCEQEI